MKTVDYIPEDLPPLDGVEKEKLRKIAALPDTQIDLDDMPELTVEQLAAMERGKLYRPIKKQITARLDADVLHWLKSKGKGYQTRMNDLLRAAMLNDL